jgi:transposase
MKAIRHALSDAQWETIRDLFPQTKGRGRPAKDHRLMIDGILWVLATGAAWRDVPARFGPWQTVYDRFSKWTKRGVWDRLLESLQAQRNAQGDIDWELFCVDGSVVRAHKAAAGARKKGGLKMSPNTMLWAVAKADSERSCTSSATAMGFRW